MDQQQLYLELYKQYRNEIQHQETQRAAVSGTCVALAGAMIGLAFQDKLRGERLFLGLLLINFSVVAIFMLRKLYERFALGRERAKLYLAAIDSCPQMIQGPGGELRAARVPSLVSLWEAGEHINERSYPLFSFVRLHHLWESLLIASGFVGVLFSISSVGTTLKTLPVWVLVVAGPAAQIAVLFLSSWRNWSHPAPTSWWDWSHPIWKRRKKH